MDVSALLAQYLSVKSQINYYQLENTKWANLHSQMSTKLSGQTKAEEKWEDTSSDMYDKLTTATGKVEYQGKTTGKINKAEGSSLGDKEAQRLAEKYAFEKVKNYDPEKLEEYAELDVNYDVMQTTYETLLSGLEAQAETLKTQLGNATKDTGMLDA